MRKFYEILINTNQNKVEFRYIQKFNRIDGAKTGDLKNDLPEFLLSVRPSSH